MPDACWILKTHLHSLALVYVHSCTLRLRFSTQGKFPSFTTHTVRKGRCSVLSESYPFQALKQNKTKKTFFYSLMFYRLEAEGSGDYAAIRWQIDDKMVIPPPGEADCGVSEFLAPAGLGWCAADRNSSPYAVGGRAAMVHTTTIVSRAEGECRWKRGRPVLFFQLFWNSSLCIVYMVSTALKGQHAEQEHHHSLDAI